MSTLNLSKLLPPRITENPAWQDFADAVDRVIQSNVMQYIQKIRDLRDPRVVESSFLALLASDLGFDLRTTLFSEEDYRRLTAALAQYYSQSGTARLPKFISFANRSIFEFQPRWTTDYVTFSPVPGGATIYEGGEWFVTPHVDVIYDGSSGVLSDLELRELFYALAPVHLVLEGIVQLFRSYTEMYIGGGVRTTIIETLESQL